MNTEPPYAGLKWAHYSRVMLLVPLDQGTQGNKGRKGISLVPIVSIGKWDQPERDDCTGGGGTQRMYRRGSKPDNSGKEYCLKMIFLGPSKTEVMFFIPFAIQCF